MRRTVLNRHFWLAAGIAIALGGCGGGDSDDSAPADNAPLTAANAKQITADSLSIAFAPRLFGDLALELTLAGLRDGGPDNAQACAGGGTLIYSGNDSDGVLSTGDRITVTLNGCVPAAGAAAVNGSFTVTATSASGSPGATDSAWSVQAQLSTAGLAIGTPLESFNLSGQTLYSAQAILAAGGQSVGTAAQATTFSVRRVRAGSAADYTLENCDSGALQSLDGGGTVEVLARMTALGLPSGNYTIDLQTQEMLQVGSDGLPTAGRLSMQARAFGLSAAFAGDTSTLSLDTDLNGTTDSTVTVPTAELSDLG